MIRYGAAPTVEENPYAPTADTMLRHRRMAEALMQDGMSYEPVQHWTQGAARVAQALMGGYLNSQNNREEQRQSNAANQTYLDLAQGADGSYSMPPQSAGPAASPSQAGMVGTQSGMTQPQAIQRSASDPASIRFNNPGAMYPGPSANRFGTTGTSIIGGGHKIAAFDSPEQGAAAQFDLLARNYSGMPLNQAIAKWSGGNSSPAYVQAVSQATGLQPNTVLSPEMLRNPQVAVPMARAMAKWEAGREFPLDEAGWGRAHSMAFGGQNAQPVQMADASNGVVPINILRQMLANPQTRDEAKRLIIQQREQRMKLADPANKLDMDYKRAQIDALRSKAANGEEQPANVREYLFTEGLSEEQRKRYFNVKRANSQVVGDTLYDKTTGQPIANMNDAIVRGEAAKQIGEAQGKSTAAAPSDIAAAENSLSLIESIRNDPNLETGVGFSSYGNLVRGTPGYDFQAKVDQARSGAFLQAIQQMRGMGALSNAEGQTATDAVTRMKTALSKEAFLEALQDYENIVRRGYENAQQRATTRNPATYMTPPQASASQGLEGGDYVYDPATGEVVRK